MSNISQPSGSDRLPVVFVLSSNYSGSHLLTQALGAHPDCADVGELGHLLKFRRRPGRNSSGTESSYAASALFSDLERRPESTWHQVVHARLRQDIPSVRVLVDNTKRTDWVLRAGARLDARFVHLVRDPRALAWRWRRTFEAEGATRRIRLREARRNWRAGLRILTGGQMHVYAQRWVRENTEFAEFLARRGVAAPVVSYEALTRHPDVEMQRLMPALGLAYDEAQLAYGTARQFGTRKPAWQGQRDGSVWATDLRWRDELTHDERMEIEALAPLQALLRRLGVVLDEDGLVPRTQATSDAGAGT